MASHHPLFLLISLLLYSLLPAQVSSATSTPAPACGSRPWTLANPGRFCGGATCCSSQEDAELRDQFVEGGFDVDDPCGPAIKSVLCARCSPPVAAAEAERNTALPASCTLPLPPRRHTRGAPRDLQAICLERIAGAGTGSSYMAMVPHPDGGNRVFLTDKVGRIWLQTMPGHGSGGTLDDEEVTLFLDLSERVPRRGAGLGVAFHHDFATNARFFVSFIDSRLYQLVVSEFTAEATPGPSETRKIFTMGLPQLKPSPSNQLNGGQLLFRRDDNEHLYLIVTDLSQDDKWKIILLNINHQNNTSGQGGNIGSHNHSITEKKPDLFAMGLGNPRGCSFDDSRGIHHLYCASVNKDQYEGVDLITRGGNYGSSSSTPFIGYSRPTVSKSSSIIGGLVYRGSMDPSLNGRYIYYYGSALWIGTPKSRDGRYAAAGIALTKCSTGTPVPMSCGSHGAHRAISGRVLTFGEDNSKDAFVLATGGVYRVVHSGLCGSGSGGAGNGTSTLSFAQLPQPVLLLSVVVFHAIIWWLYIKQLCGSTATNAGGGSEQQAGTMAIHSGSTYNIQCCMSWMCCNGGRRSGQAC